ncbi:hypothetical protein ACQFX9_10120 [Aliinostoc sp. HNIBRCY26]|uniref:hypothetical protein n=1 Tax=Aliinostoc sp. HNIBRCY26 TaxID=3418997 RepID=UPI003D0710C1
MDVTIQLSLAGDGRLLVLTPQTVRQVFFQVIAVNREYTGRQKFPLHRPFHKQFPLWKHKCKTDGYIYRSTSIPYGEPNSDWQETEVTLLDVLYRKYLDREKLAHFNHKEIKYIETELNKQIIRNNLSLVDNEGVLLSGYGVCNQAGKNREKIRYIRRYGMIFILEPIMRQTILKSENLDLLIQDNNFDLHLVRYHGLLLATSPGIQLLFRHRLDFSITWTCTIKDFQPRQIFRVQKIYPCDGFRIIQD